MSVGEVIQILIKNGNLGETDIEWFEYGFSSIVNTIFSVLIMSLIGSCFDSVWNGILFWYFSNFLRRNAGGYYAKTRGRCIIFSISLIISMYCFMYIGIRKMSTYFLCILIANLIIILSAPIENINKKLDELEKKIYRYRTLSVLFIEDIIFIVSLFIPSLFLMKAIIMAESSVSILLF